MMIAVRVLFLGPARDFAKSDLAVLELQEGSSVAEARRAITERYPRLGEGLPTMRLAVNQEFVADTKILCADDELAIIPPVSGG